MLHNVFSQIAASFGVWVLCNYRIRPHWMIAIGVPLDHIGQFKPNPKWLMYIRCHPMWLIIWVTDHWMIQWPVLLLTNQEPLLLYMVKAQALCFLALQFVYIVYWWKGVTTLPWGARDCQKSLWHCDCFLNTFYTSHCQLPDMVWSLQQVEDWPSTEEEQTYRQQPRLCNSFPTAMQ